MNKRIARGALLFFGGLVLLSLAGAGWQAAATAMDARSVRGPGAFADVGGRRVHYHCSGEGSPLILLESGLPRGALDWALVQPELSRTTRVCSYDRAGYGLSDPGPKPRDARQLNFELAALLEVIAPQQPLVLVGHSWGGLLSLRFAAEHRQKVLALVLLDPTSSQQATRMPKSAQAEWDDSLSALWWLAKTQGLGLPRLFADTLAEHFGETARLKNYPLDVRHAQRALIMRSGFFQTALDEVSVWRDTMAQAQAAGSLGTLPVRVLIAGRDKPDWERALQRELSSLSTQTELTTIADSGHEVHSERPDLVIAAIREMVLKARQN